MVDVWPTLDAFRGRLSVDAWQDPADEADAESALDAAVAYVVERSTRYRRNGTDATVYRGTLDLAVSLYERRGSNVDPFDGLTPAQRTAFHRLLGISRHALPFVGGAASSSSTSSPGGVEYATADHTHESTQTGRYRFDSSTTVEDPGSGRVRTNGTAVADATFVALSTSTLDGIDARRWLAAGSAGDGIVWQRAADAAQYGRLTVTSVEVFDSWARVGVTVDESGGDPMPKNVDVLVRWVYR